MTDAHLRALNRKYAQARRRAVAELIRRHDEEYWALYRAERIKQEKKEASG